MPLNRAGKPKAILNASAKGLEIDSFDDEDLDSADFQGFGKDGMEVNIEEIDGDEEIGSRELQGFGNDSGEVDVEEVDGEDIGSEETGSEGGEDEGLEGIVLGQNNIMPATRLLHFHRASDRSKGTKGPWDVRVKRRTRFDVDQQSVLQQPYGWNMDGITIPSAISYSPKYGNIIVP